MYALKFVATVTYGCDGQTFVPIAHVLILYIQLHDAAEQLLLIRIHVCGCRAYVKSYKATHIIVLYEHITYYNSHTSKNIYYFYSYDY